MRTLIEAGRLLAGPGLEPRPDACLVVEDGIITEIRPAPPPGPFNAREDLRGQVVMPGLIDTHVHLQLTPGPDHQSGRTRYQTERESGLLPLTAMRHARIALSAGITTLRDLGADMSILAVRDAISAGEPGPRLLVAGLPITTTAGHCHWFGEVRADTAEDMQRTARWLAEQGVDVVKVMASGGNMTPGSNALQPQYSAAELAVAAGEAHRLGRRVAAHALNVQAIQNCVEAGVDSIEHCSFQLADGSLGYDRELGELIARDGPAVGITGSGILRVLLDQGEAGRTELRRTLSAHRELLRAGALIGVHSDAGVRFTRFERFDLSLEVMTVGLDVPPVTALIAATATAATIIGLESELGTIEVGKRADLLALTADPLADIGNVRTVAAVFRDGIRLVDRGRLTVPADMPPDTGAVLG